MEGGLLLVMALSVVATVLRVDICEVVEIRLSHVIGEIGAIVSF